MMQHIKVLLAKTWIRECTGRLFIAPVILASKPYQENVTNIRDFIWRMRVSYWALSKIILPFQYPIGRYDDTIEHLGDGSGVLFFITLDCTQCDHQILIRIRDQEKLVFFAPDRKKYTYTILPSNVVNTPPFYTTIIRSFQAQWTYSFQVYCNNKPKQIGHNCN